jgi:hypothetical protein
MPVAAPGLEAFIGGRLEFAEAGVKAWRRLVRGGRLGQAGRQARVG